jgi:hypothetical protein
MEKTVLDQALHALVGDVLVIPRLHGKREQRSKNFTGGGRARAKNPSAGGGQAEKARLRLGVLKMEGKTPIYRGKVK